MPIATANGKEFEFPDGTTPEQMGLAIDEYFAGSAEQDASSIPEKLIGGAEVGLSMAGGALGEVLGGASGVVAAANPFDDMTGGDQVKAVQEMFRYDPRSEEGKKYLEAIGGSDLVQKISGALQQAEQYTGDVGYSTGEALGIEGAPEVLGAAYSAIPTAVGELLGGAAAVGAKQVAKQAPKVSSSLARAMKGEKTLFPDKAKSVGAAETPKELERAAVSGSMPVPFEGDSAFTKGQVTRNYEQLQFEKEMAKRGEAGAPLRERAENQTAVLIENLDALADRPGPIHSELRDIGKGLDSALKGRFTREKKKVDSLYDRARRAGEMQDPVEMSTIPDMLEDIERFEGVAPNASAIRKEAVKRGAVVDFEGNLIPSSMSLDDTEMLRAFVNASTDLSNPQQARIRRIAISAIDEATENAGGDIFKEARKARAKMGREFENVGITKRLLASKKGTDERSIAYEDVFKKVMLDSPIEEINKLRSTLLKSGDNGKQAWADLKAKGIEHIKETAQSASQSDSMGNPLISTDKLNRSIQSLDRDGKLESIYGKRNAQVLRDLGDLAKDIYTAPPGAINHSNTASALQVALDSLAGFAVTGIPAPVATTLHQVTKYVKSNKTKKQIEESLNYLEKRKP